MTFRENIEPLNIIVAVDEEGGFGKDGKIPWHFPEDFKHFKQVTKGGICIMGRVTYQDMYDMILQRKMKNKNSTKEKKKPVKISKILPGRHSIVISRSMKEVEGADVFPTLIEAAQSLKQNDPRQVFILGGERLFIQSLPFVNTVYMTVVKGRYDCDRFFPVKALEKFKIIDGKQTENLYFVTYQRVRKYNEGRVWFV